ncbi:MAG: hypothetical protein LUG50_11650 [Planctomycetaceae bacterium]|nr:hypothetical protein [Planctomycetaceae bacterium]
MNTINHDVVAARTETIVRMIASGNNECGTLMSGGKVNVPFLRSAIVPTLNVYRDEVDMLRHDNLRISEESEKRRQALELIYSNAHDRLPRQVAVRLCEVLGRTCG